MARHKSSSYSLIFTLAMSWYGCGDSGSEEPTTPGIMPVVPGAPVVTPQTPGTPTTPTTPVTPVTPVVTPVTPITPVTPVTPVTPIVDAGLNGGDGGVAMGNDGGAGGGQGDCCPDKNCLCSTPPPAMLSGRTKGPFKTATLNLTTGTVYYPTDGKPPYASVALCGGFLNSGPEMVEWGSFYASWGIVTNITGTFPTDFPDVRAGNLLAAVEELKKENSKAGSPLNGKLSDRYGTSGYSMGGGGTTIAANMTPALKTSVGLAAWGPDTSRTKVPTLLLCGAADIVAPCSDHTDPAYTAIPAGTPKMKITLDDGDHLAAWFGPADGQGGVSGGWALAFQKVYLEGDTRWKTLLLSKPTGAMVVSAGIQ